jgi:hypothetical protein
MNNSDDTQESNRTQRKLTTWSTPQEYNEHQQQHDEFQQ